MATWIVHLRLAETLLDRIGDLDPPYLAIGNSVPDSGILDEKWETFNPPPEVSHFKAEMPAAFELADLNIYRRYLRPLRGAMDDRGVSVLSRDSEGRQFWHAYREVLENDSLFVLVYGKWQYAVFPKRAFQTDHELERFRGFLQANIHARSPA